MKTYSLVFAGALSLVGCKDSNPHPNVVDAHHIDAPLDALIDAPDSCIDPSTGCFKSDVCEPTQLTDYLNACTTVACETFDDVTRLPLYNNGNLPPLP